MEVVALVPGRDHVCTRYRIAQFGRHLAAVGLDLRLEPLGATAADRYQQLAQRRPRQVVLLVRKLLPMWQLALLRRSAPLLIYDFDDAVFLRDSFHPRGPYSMTRAVRFHAILRLCDLAVAGNGYLADAAVRHVKARKVQIIPTCVDPRRYRPARHEASAPTRLVWIGSKSTVRSLDDARAVLEAIGRDHPDTVLRVICDRFPRFEHLQVEPAPWSSATENDDLSESDIGISWMPDDAWSRGKCGLKVLQYMAAGLPVVASPVGVHREMIQGDLGFLPETADDWVARVGQLADDHRLRADMGRAGRQRLESGFHVDTWGPVLADHLKEAASRV